VAIVSNPDLHYSGDRGNEAEGESQKKYHNGNPEGGPLNLVAAVKPPLLDALRFRSVVLFLDQKEAFLPVRVGTELIGVLELDCCFQVDAVLVTNASYSLSIRYFGRLEEKTKRPFCLFQKSRREEVALCHISILEIRLWLVGVLFD
jgi:hypothetical protein